MEGRRRHGIRCTLGKDTEPAARKRRPHRKAKEGGHGLAMWGDSDHRPRPRPTRTGRAKRRGPSHAGADGHALCPSGPPGQPVKRHGIRCTRALPDVGRRSVSIRRRCLGRSPPGEQERWNDRARTLRIQASRHGCWGGEPPPKAVGRGEAPSGGVGGEARRA